MATIPSPLGVTLLFNGVPYNNCDVELSIDRNWSRSQTGYVLNVKPIAEHTDLFVPLVANYENTRLYRIQLMEQQIKVLLHRLMYLFPQYAFSVADCEYLDNPSVESESGIVITKYKQITITLGQLTSLIWFSDQELHDQVEEKIAPYKQKEEEEAHKKQQEDDPLYAWKEKMTRIGHAFDWRLSIAQVSDKKEDYCVGDTLVSVRCPGLHVFETMITIGPLHKLNKCTDEELRTHILRKHNNALYRYQGAGIRNEESASPA